MNTQPSTFFENIWLSAENGIVVLERTGDENNDHQAQMFVNYVHPIVKSIYVNKGRILAKLQSGKGCGQCYRNITTTVAILKQSEAFYNLFIKLLKWIAINKFDPLLPQGKYTYLFLGVDKHNHDHLVLFAGVTDDANAHAGNDPRYVEGCTGINKMNIDFILNKN